MATAPVSSRRAALALRRHTGSVLLLCTIIVISPIGAHASQLAASSPHQQSQDLIQHVDGLSKDGNFQYGRDILLKNLDPLATLVTGLATVLVAAFTYIHQAQADARREVEQADNDRRQRAEQAENDRKLRAENWQKEHRQREQEAHTRRVQWELEYVQRQLGDLYGPLLGRLENGRVAMDSAMRALAQRKIVEAKHIFEDYDKEQVKVRKDWKWFEFESYDKQSGRRSGSYAAQDERIVRHWRSWVRTVIQPNNEAMVELLLNGRHLIHDVRSPEDRAANTDGPRVLFDAMINHIVSYRPVIAAWDEEEAKGTPLENMYAYQNTASVRFPGELGKYVKQSYDALGEKKQKLLDELADPSSGHLETRRQSLGDAALLGMGEKAPSTVAAHFVRQAMQGKTAFVTSPGLPRSSQRLGYHDSARAMH